MKSTDSPSVTATSLHDGHVLVATSNGLYCRDCDCDVAGGSL